MSQIRKRFLLFVACLLLIAGVEASTRGVPPGVERVEYWLLVGFLAFNLQMLGNDLLAYHEVQDFQPYEMRWDTPDRPVMTMKARFLTHSLFVGFLVLAVAVYGSTAP